MGRCIELWGYWDVVNVTLRTPIYWDEAIAHLCQVDEVLRELISIHHHSILGSSGDVFRTLVRSVVGQQISSKAAESVWGRFESSLASVSPDCVAVATHQQLRDFGMSNSKADYIQGIAETWMNGYCEVDWDSLDDNEVSSMLVRIKGVGKWTAQMVLIFSLLRPDVFPIADRGAIRSMEMLYNSGDSLSESEILEISGKWGPFRTVATWFLWRSLDPKQIQY
tara:strand:- start:3526 stop:4194 length:669 start_codon:yes stop_codon:yes gene_type:complete